MLRPSKALSCAVMGWSSESCPASIASNTSSATVSLVMLLVALLVGVLFVEDLARFLLNEQGGAGVDVDLLKGGGRYAQQGDEQAEDQKKSKKAAFFHGNVPRSMLQ